MIRIYLLLFLIAAGYAVVRKFLLFSPIQRKRVTKSILLSLLIIVLLILGGTGHLNWLLAAGGVVVAFLLRSLPLLLRYGPELQRLWRMLRGSKPSYQADTQTESESFRSAKNTNTAMTAAEAYKILGLTPDANRQEIIAAHKKLMQKMHPDRGGSVYIASQINLAKDMLLKIK